MRNIFILIDLNMCRLAIVLTLFPAALKTFLWHYGYCITFSFILLNYFCLLLSILRGFTWLIFRKCLIQTKINFLNHWRLFLLLNLWDNDIFDHRDGSFILLFCFHFLNYLLPHLLFLDFWRIGFFFFLLIWLKVFWFIIFSWSTLSLSHFTRLFCLFQFIKKLRFWRFNCFSGIFSFIFGLIKLLSFLFTLLWLILSYILLLLLNNLIYLGFDFAAWLTGIWNVHLNLWALFCFYGYFDRFWKRLALEPFEWALFASFAFLAISDLIIQFDAFLSLFLLIEKSQVVKNSLKFIILLINMAIGA